MHTERYRIKNKFSLEYDFHRLILFPVGKFSVYLPDKYVFLNIFIYSLFVGESGRDWCLF